MSRKASSYERCLGGCEGRTADPQRRPRAGSRPPAGLRSRGPRNVSFCRPASKNKAHWGESPQGTAPSGRRIVQNEAAFGRDRGSGVRDQHSDPRPPGPRRADSAKRSQFDACDKSLDQADRSAIPARKRGSKCDSGTFVVGVNLGESTAGRRDQNSGAWYAPYGPARSHQTEPTRPGGNGKRSLRSLPMVLLIRHRQGLRKACGLAAATHHLGMDAVLRTGPLAPDRANSARRYPTIPTLPVLYRSTIPTGAFRAKQTQLAEHFNEG